MAQNGQLQKDLESLRSDISKLRSDLGDVVGHAVDAGRSRGAAVKDKVVETGKKAAEKTEETIKDRPFISVLVVFLLGILLGKMIDAKLRS